MWSDRYSARQAKLTHAIRKSGVSAFLVTNPRNVSYLTGFRGEDSCLLIEPGRIQLYSDSRFETQIREECPDLPMQIRTSRMAMDDFLAESIPKLGLKNLGIEGASMVVSLHDRMVEKLKPLELVPLSGPVEELRQIKDGDEVAELRLAIHQAERGFDVMRSLILPDQTERQAAHELEHGMRRFGAVRAAFEPIIAVGDHAALPHYRAGMRTFRESGFALVDWGALSPLGYHSDLTRLLVTSKLPPKLTQIYKVVLQAQQAAIDAIRPGVKCQDVDAAARRVIDQAGYGKYFGHGLGHGIGLEIHEGPRLSPLSTDLLKPGMTITVEPGIYLPGFGGVRIEDDVLITRDGCEVMTSLPKDAPFLTG